MADTPKLILDDDWKKKPEAPKAPAAGNAPAGGGAGAAPGIFVDSDWKSQAQAEKERLAAAEKAKAEADAAKGGKSAGRSGRPEMPEPEFMGLVSMLVSQALMYLGAVPDPETGRAMVAPEYARYNIDLLEILQVKTKGNLTADEQQELDGVISELKLRLVEISRAVEKMMAERAAKAAAGGGAGPGGMGPGGFGPGVIGRIDGGPR
ncbi:MAG: DUF1844 domain-containing protein [Planctomycetaceae bacterium]|jgi:hypothetical protein|nr:DUF1844 domain-containing protein [Phycisphaerales bacterium]MCE2653864.1 DUF1844 domain-containing protein [Planctomycetaceae bacterium]